MNVERTSKSGSLNWLDEGIALLRVPIAFRLDKRSRHSIEGAYLRGVLDGERRKDKRDMFFKERRAESSIGYKADSLIFRCPPTASESPTEIKSRPIPLRPDGASAVNTLLFQFTLSHQNLGELIDRRPILLIVDIEFDDGIAIKFEIRVRVDLRNRVVETLSVQRVNYPTRAVLTFILAFGTLVGLWLWSVKFGGDTYPRNDYLDPQFVSVIAATVLGFFGLPNLAAVLGFHKTASGLSFFYTLPELRFQYGALSILASPLVMTVFIVVNLVTFSYLLTKELPVDLKWAEVEELAVVDLKMDGGGTRLIEKAAVRSAELLPTKSTVENSSQIGVVCDDVAGEDRDGLVVLGTFERSHHLDLDAELEWRDFKILICDEAGENTPEMASFKGEHLLNLEAKHFVGFTKNYSPPEEMLLHIRSRACRTNDVSGENSDLTFVKGSQCRYEQTGQADGDVEFETFRWSLNRVHGNETLKKIIDEIKSEEKKRERGNFETVIGETVDLITSRHFDRPQYHVRAKEVVESIVEILEDNKINDASERRGLFVATALMEIGSDRKIQRLVAPDFDDLIEAYRKSKFSHYSRKEPHSLVLQKRFLGLFLGVEKGLLYDESCRVHEEIVATELEAPEPNRSNIREYYRNWIEENRLEKLSSPCGTKRLHWLNGDVVATPAANSVMEIDSESNKTQEQIDHGSNIENQGLAHGANEQL